MDDRQPVLVGIGTAGDPARQPPDAPDTAGLMAEALRAALADAGGAPSLGPAVGSILSTRGSWQLDDPARLVAIECGLDPDVRTVVAELGVPQSAVIHRAAATILAGEADVVVVLGAETRARAQRASRAGIEIGERWAGREPDERWHPAELPISRLEIDAGLVQAIDHYAMLENAVRAHDGRSIADHRAEVAALWAGFNRIAGANPEAWFPGPRTAAELATPAPENRPLAFPYCKWHSTQWTVDQATCLVLCSAAAARRHRVPADRWVFPRAGADHDTVVPVTERIEPHRCPGARAVAGAALAMADLELDDVDHLDLYSCFPVAVRLQAREIGIPADRDLTVTGGMAFAGGPFNHYTFWSTAAVARRIRETPGGTGLVTAVSGMLTKQGATVWADEPGDGFWHADLTGAVADATPRVPCSAEGAGPGRVAVYTVHYAGLEPSAGFAVVDLDTGGRVLARLEQDQAAAATTEELVGAAVEVAEGRVHRR